MTAIDTSLPSITIVKSFQYRGAPEEYSNTYFFNGTMPASPTSWKALADAVIASEKGIYDSATEVVRAIGHQAGQSVAVWSYDYEAHSASVPGTLTPGASATYCPGDAAVWVRWSTTQLTSKGKPIYLRSYFHGAYNDLTGGDADTIAPNQKTALQTFGTAWVTGFADADAVTHHRAGPHGAVGQSALPCDFVTTRTLERRGRRP
jgi:hypothetical protein